MTTSNRSGLGVLGFGAAACAVCCAGPILAFLGGVGVWEWPKGGDAARGKPVMKVTVQFADGTAEEHILENGRQFADALVRADVPLSSDAGDFTGRGQLRYFAINLSKKTTLSKITL